MSPRCLIAAVCLAATAAAAPKEKTRPGPAAHYVIRTSDLNATLSFTSAVLGLRVLRHEENPEACPITCWLQRGTMRAAAATPRLSARVVGGRSPSRLASRLVSAAGRSRGLAATGLHGMSTSRPRRRRDWSPRNVHVRGD